MVELHRGQNGLGISLAGNKDRRKMSVFVCGLHPSGSAYKQGQLQVGDEILEVSKQFLYRHFITTVLQGRQEGMDKKKKKEWIRRREKEGGKMKRIL